MPLVLDGTNGVSGVNGSASSPAFEGTDADSGIFINSANEVNASLNSTPVWSAVSTFGFKNRIINGAMVIDQRNNGASVTPANSQYFIDRWMARLTQTSKYSVQQSSVAPTGFSNSMLVTSLSAYSVGVSDFFFVTQLIEGFNAADFAWGTANAQTVTLSFWVRSSLTGTFGGSFRAGASTRSYPFTYTISSANTWEQKSITVPGDTSGTWSTNNTTWGEIDFGLGAGGNFSGTAGAWSGSTLVSATGATSVVGTNGATFYITGVQLEKGSTATSFDFRSIGTELALCQRYCYVPSGVPLFSLAWVGGSLAFQGGQLTHPHTMRATPTISGVTSFTIQGVTASAVGFALSATTHYLALGGTNSNSQADGALRAVNPNQIPIISAEL